MKKKTVFIWLIVFNLIITIPSFRFLLKFGNIYALIFYLCFANLLFFLFLKSKLKFSLLKKNIWLFSVLGIAVLNFFIYPKVDGRKNTVNHGSTADDAVILAGESLRNSGKIYNLKISDNEPISPGPGWIIMNLPFTYSVSYFLFSPVYLLILFFILKHYENSDSINNYFLFFLSLSGVFWEMLFNGHDIIPLSLSLFILTYLYLKNIKEKGLWVQFFTLSLFLGLVATGRIVFMIYPFFLFLAGLKINYKKSGLLLILSSSVAGLLHLYYYSVNENYQPFHLISKAVNILGFYPLMAFGGLLFLLFLLLFFNKKQFNAYLLISFLLSLILIPIGYGDLLRVSFDFKVWEGANYIFPLSPFLIFYALKKYNHYV